MFRFNIFTCCSFLICDFNLSSHLGFHFLSAVFRDTSIFSLTNFAPAYIKSLKSVMLFVGIFVNQSFTFSVSDLPVLQSWFLREQNVVFFSDMILFIISTFIFPSWLIVCVFVFAVWRSSLFSVWFWLGVSDFPVFSILVIVSGVCWCFCLYIYRWIYGILRLENQSFFVIVVTWSASLWFVVLNLANSVQIFIFLFLYHLFVGLLLKQ